MKHQSSRLRKGKYKSQQHPTTAEEEITTEATAEEEDMIEAIAGEGTTAEIAMETDTEVARETVQIIGEDTDPNHLILTTEIEDRINVMAVEHMGTT